MRRFSWIFVTVLICGIAMGEDISDNFSYDGLTRSYLLHIPPQHNGIDSLPLVIALHGYGSYCTGFMNYIQMNTKGDTEGFLVCYPNGTGSENRAWNAGMCCTDTSGPEVDDVGFISALIDTIMEGYVVDTFRIYATGMSNGGMMSHRLACELSDRIAAVAPVAGGLVLADFDDCQPERAIPVMHIHAIDDDVVFYYGGSHGEMTTASIDSVMRTWARKDSCDLGPDTTEFTGAFVQKWSRSTDEGPPIEVHSWTTNDGGHTWPGSVNGTQAIIANDLMWDFFTAHPMPDDESGVAEEPGFKLDPANPGIFTRSTAIRFAIDEAQQLTLTLYDAAGRKVAVLVEGTLDAGQHSVVLDASSFPDGVYFYRLVTPGFATTRSLTVIR